MDGRPAQSTIDVEFPTAVRALIVRGDEAARASVGRITLEPRLVARTERSGRYVARAQRYGPFVAYFLDDNAFAEPIAFWIRGGSQSEVLFQHGADVGSAQLALRNAPVNNRLTIESGAWRHDLALAPGQQTTVSVPLDRQRGATRVRFTSAAGFRPSEFEKGSSDRRFLGVWVKPE